MRSAVNILGVEFAPLTFAQAVTMLVCHVQTRASGSTPNLVVVTPNPEGVMLVRRNRAFARALE